MRRKNLLVEPLESRCLLSIAGAALSPPLSAGAKWTSTNGNNTESTTVIGNTTIMGHPVTKVQDTSTNDEGGTNTSLIYVGKDSANDIVVWAEHDTASNASGSSVTDISFASGFVELPASMTAGQSQTFTTEATGTSSFTSASTGKTTTTTNTNTEKLVITLVSASTQTVTVPAGTFKCYQIKVANTITPPKGNPFTTTANHYLTTGGLPPIKTVDTGVDTSTTVLTSFNGPKKPAAKLAIDTPPSDVKLNTAMTPAIQIDVDDADGGIVFDNTSTVSLAIASGPTGGVMSGTTSVKAVQGTATFSGLKFSKPGKYTLKATDGSLTSVTTQAFNVTSTSTATKLAFGVQPSDIAVGKSIAPAVTVKVEDANGNIVTTDDSIIALDLTGSIPVGASLGGTVDVKAVNGIATFSMLDVNMPGTYKLLAADGSLTSATSNSFVVSSALKATKLAFTVQPASTVAGKVISPSVKVTVETAGGATVVTDHSTITLTLGSGTGGLGGTLTATAVNGIATFSNLSLTKTGAFTLKATDGSLTSATSNTFNITPATASKLAFAATPATELAGKSISPAVVVDIEDAFGNIVTTSSATVAMTVATGGSTLTGTTSVAAHAGVATFSNVVLSKLGKYTLKATANSVASATSGAFSVVPGPAAKLVLVKSPTSATAGKAISPALVIDIEDALGNIVTSNTSTVKFTATGGSALTGTFSVAAKAGVATFLNLILTKAAKYTLKATDGVLASATSASFTVNPAAASKLVFAPAPSAATAGKSITPSLVVDVEDAFGNIVTTNTSTVTLGVSTGPTGGVLSGTVAVAAKAGVATFSNVQIKKAGSYALKATDGVLTSAKSSTIKVNAAAASKLVITKAPTTGKANTSLAFAVTIEDAFGNVATTNTSKITFSILSGPSGATITGNAISAIAGIANFTGLKLSKAGAYKLKATDGTLASATTGTVTIT